ncbi:MAG TPA: cardiolipin synthase [Flavobacterium sp.]|nr:cardiolipin synthase [Flavobacterium sp.]
MENWSLLFDFIAKWYFIPIAILHIAVILTVLFENRNPEKAIAWVMVVTFLPGVGIGLYYFFGQEFRKNKRFDQIEQKFAKDSARIWNEMKSVFSNQIDEIRKTSPELAQTFQYLVNTKNSFPTSNNQVDLLINGEAKFPKLIDDIKRAQHHIHLEYYIVEEDDFGKMLMNLLVEKVEQGIEVRLLVDAFGSSTFTKRQDYYRSKGIEFEIMLPVRFHSLANSNYRDHRKIAVIDGVIGYAGGINLSQKYSNDYANEVYWRDTSARIYGDAVKVLQVQFLLHWQLASETDFKYDKVYFPEISQTLEHLPMTYAFSSPGKSIPYTMEVMINCIMNAKKSVKLCTPYFIPTDEFRTALFVAKSKGIEVELMLPYQGDSYVVQSASMSFLKRLAERNIKIFMYQKGFIHAKTISIDGQTLFVGSTNLDTRSFLINFEFSAIMNSPELCQIHDQQFETDKKMSKMFTIDYWENQKWYKKAFAALCRLLSPLL